jgi:hypothetical protein
VRNKSWQRWSGAASWVGFFLALALVLAVGGGCVYAFKADWAERVYDLARTSRTVVPAQDDKIGRKFAAPNQKYGKSPLDAGAEQDDKVNSLLASLQKEPCDKQAVFQVTVALEGQRAFCAPRKSFSAR